MKLSTLVVILIIILIGGTLAACSGVGFGDIVKVQTPLELQQQHGYPSKMSLNEAKQTYPVWFESTQRNGIYWKSEIEDADALAGMLNQLTLQQLESLGPEIAGIPALVPAAPIATGLLGLIIAQIKNKRDNQKSYNKGLQVGAETALKGANPYAPQAFLAQSGAVIQGADYKG